MDAQLFSEFGAEFLGTMLLIILGVGVCCNVCLKQSKGFNSGWIVITTGWALGVFAGVVVAGPVSGAHLNPAVTVGLAIAGKFPVAKIAAYIAAQMLGAMLGAGLVWFAYKDHFDATDDKATKLGVFSTGPAIRNYAVNFFTEVLGTFVLMFCVFYFADGTFTAGGVEAGKVGLGSVGAIPVTFIVWAIGLSLGGPTGYAINPARDLGPRIMHAILPIKDKGTSDWGYAWLPVVAPIVGAAIAAGVYLCNWF